MLSKPTSNGQNEKKKYRILDVWVSYTYYLNMQSWETAI